MSMVINESYFKAKIKALKQIDSKTPEQERALELLQDHSLKSHAEEIAALEFK